jgi:ankyrin repeat protein
LPFTPDGSEEFIASTKGSLEARNLVKLALVLEDQGYYREARENFQRAVKMFELSPGPQDTVTIFCLDKLSSLLRSASQYKMAEAYSRKCLDARIKIYGMSALPTLLSCGNLAVAMRYQNKHQTAYSLLRDALEKTHPYFSELIPRVRLLSILAKINMDCGMYDVAESLSCDVIRMSIGLYGKGHPYTLNRISDLGVIFAWKDNMPGAEAISCFALDGLEQALGRNHPLCLRTSRRLADYIRFQHRYDEASIRLERTLEAQKMQPGSHHPDTLSTMSSLGTVYALQGYIKDAEVLLREAHQGQEASLGLKHSSTQWTSYALSGLKVLQQEYASQDMSRDRKVQPRLLEFLGPKSGPVTKYDLKRNPHINSPFGDALDDNIITAAIEGDYFGLETTLKRNTVSEQTIARALREAAASCQETALTLLLDCGAPINEPGGFHGTALQAASFAGNKAVVQRLLDQRADINIAGGIFGNPIGASILGHHADVTRLLLTHHPGQIFAQEILDSSLQFAIATGQDSIVKTLLEIGADVNAEDNLFGSPLHQAISSGQKEIISLLLAHNADVDKNEGIFGCPLEAAIAMDDKFAIERLLKSRANLRPLYSGLTSQPSDDYSKGYETTLARLLLGKPMNNLEVTEFSSTNTPAIPDSYPLAMSAIVSQEPPTLPISQPGESIKVVSNTSRPITGSKPKSSQQSAQIPGLRRRALKECRRVLERVLRIKNIPKHKKLRLGKRNKYKDI